MGWRELAVDLLKLIADKLRHAELIHFGAVCKSWRSLYLKNLCLLPKDLPLSLCYPRPFGAPILLLSCKPQQNSRKYACINGEIINRRIYFPEAANKWICGSNWGWLVLIDIRGLEICLLNPLTRRQIQLPSLDCFPGLDDDHEPRNSFRFIAKAIMSSNPGTNPNECVVMAIVGNSRKLCFCKLGDYRWTNVAGFRGHFEDLVYYENRFFAIDKFGATFSCNGKDPNAEYQIAAFGPRMPAEIPRRYLVVSAGNLLQVFRYEKSYYNVDGITVSDYDDDDEMDDDYVIDNDMDDDYDNEEDNENDAEADAYVDDNWIKTETVKFALFKLVTEKRRPNCNGKECVAENFRCSVQVARNWVELESLKEHSLFLGYNGTLSVPAQLLPNCKGNLIYFTDDHHQDHIRNLLVSEGPVQAYHDIGIFYLDDKRVTSYHPNNSNDLMPSVWITPNPW